MTLSSLIIYHLHDKIIILHIHCHHHCWSHHSYSPYSSPPSYIFIYIITTIVKAVVVTKISVLKRKTHAQVGGKKWMLLISSSLQFVSEHCWRDIIHVELRIKMLITQVCFMCGWMCWLGRDDDADDDDNDLMSPKWRYC